MGMSLTVLILLGSVVSTSAAQPTVLWNGDFQTGDFSQWRAIVEASPGRVSITSSPSRPGYGETARFIVEPGDHTNSPRSERAEVRSSQEQAGGYEGVETWFGWSTFFPDNLNPPVGKTSIFTQWHQTHAVASENCPPNFAFKVDARHSLYSIVMAVRGGSLSHCEPGSYLSWVLGPLTLDTWHDFVLHVRWSSAPTVGFVEAWMDGRVVVPRTSTATLYKGQGAYLRQGFYRPSYSLTSTIFDTATKRGNSYQAVAP
jgi:hypothetical protein